MKKKNKKYNMYRQKRTFRYAFLINKVRNIFQCALLLLRVDYRVVLFQN